MSLLSTSHTHSFKRTKSTLYTIILSLCFVFANSAFASSNPSSSVSQNTEVYLITTDWIDSNSSLIFNPVSEEYFLSKTESSNSSLDLMLSIKRRNKTYGTNSVVTFFMN